MQKKKKKINTKTKNKKQSTKQDWGKEERQEQKPETHHGETDQQTDRDSREHTDYTHKGWLTNGTQVNAEKGREITQREEMSKTC